MSQYILTVKRIDPNPAYDAEKAQQAASNQRFAGSWPHYDIPSTLEARVLEVALDDMEYETIKHAVLEIWK